MNTQHTHKNRLLLSLIVIASCVPFCAMPLQGSVLAAFQGGPPAPQADQDAVFNQALQAYQQNQFTAATEKFQQVTGPHSQEAQQYIARMKAYHDAMQVAKTIVGRSADERDPHSLAYAIEQVQAAMKIKPDGPYQPQQLLDEARQLKDAVERQRAGDSKTSDQRFCDQAMAAAREHRYNTAKQFSCLLADDNPTFACGGDEAAHLCDTNTELAELEKSAPSVPVSNPVSSGAKPDVLAKAKAAYGNNDFERARDLFERVDGDSKPAADEFLDKITRYNQSFTKGDELARNGNYEQAQTAFLAAAGIKPDGPGNPQSRASKMELLLGLDQFFSGDYVSATQHLQDCAANQTGKQPLVHFYLGASKLARFFVTGSDDSALRQDALNDLKVAKQAGFKTTGQDVSPKIRQAYENLPF